METFINRLFDAFEKNLIVSSAIAGAMVLTVCYMWSQQIPVPKAMEAALMLVLGYFLGAKAQGAIRHRRDRKSV